MANYFLTDADGIKQGPLTEERLQTLIERGVITPTTPLETDAGHTGLARQIPGLKFNTATLSTDSPFVNVSISGNGKGNPAILLYWIMFIVGAVIFYAICASIVHNINDQVANARGALFVDQAKLNQAGTAASVFAFAAILLPMLCVVLGILYHLSVAGTHIQVDETGVEGKGVGQYFIWGDLRLFNFRFAYNQIISVAVTGNSIIVHASGVQYECYVANPAEIQRVNVEPEKKPAGKGDFASRQGCGPR